MKQVLGRTIVAATAASLLALSAVAGTDTHDSKDVKEVKEMKQVAPEAPLPPSCDWSGPYVGLHSGGQFGHSSTHDFITGRDFGYDESGFNGGLQLGYNFQWKWLVTGPEFDLGYMNLHGSGDEPRFTGVRGETDSDFYTTMRGRVGVRLDCHGCWLVYATGGAIGLNYTTRYRVEPNFFDSRGNNFSWGYTVGGGVERKIGGHWSVKAEYLYFSVGDQSFGEPINNVPVEFHAQTFGHIIRAGLNYQF